MGRATLKSVSSIHHKVGGGPGVKLKDILGKKEIEKKLNKLIVESEKKMEQELTTTF